MKTTTTNSAPVPRDDELVGVPSHPVAVGAGALVVGAAAGAAAGTVAGPVGTLAGAAVGALMGGLGADAVAESVDEVRAKDAEAQADTRDGHIPVLLAKPVAGTVQGEGDYASARRFNASETAFVKSGRVEQAARDAAPTSRGEAEEMERAEEAGKRRSKERSAAAPGDVPATDPRRGVPPSPLPFVDE